MVFKWSQVTTRILDVIFPQERNRDLHLRHNLAYGLTRAESRWLLKQQLSL